MAPDLRLESCHLLSSFNSQPVSASPSTRDEAQFTAAKALVDLRGIPAAECPEPSHLTAFRRTGPLEGSGAVNVKKKRNGPTATHAHHTLINEVQPPFAVIQSHKPARKPVDSANEKCSSATAELINGPEVMETGLDASSKKTGSGRKRKRDESCSNCWLLQEKIKRLEFEKHGSSETIAQIKRSLIFSLQILDQRSDKELR